ncbi:MAG: hypothetical protein ACON4T_07350 [Synechococcus sp.]
MSDPSDPRQRRQLHPLPKGLVELYGLLAVLMVLIPEWLAEGTLLLEIRRGGDAMPMTTRAWRTLPELQLASMNLRELRALARELRLWGYGSDCRDLLSQRLLQRIKREGGGQHAL